MIYFFEIAQCGTQKLHSIKGKGVVDILVNATGLSSKFDELGNDLMGSGGGGRKSKRT